MGIHFEKNGFPLKHCGNDGKIGMGERNGLLIQGRGDVISATTLGIIVGRISKSYFSNASIWSFSALHHLKITSKGVFVASRKITSK